MKRCPHCGGNVATFCKQCTYCKAIIPALPSQSTVPPIHTINSFADLAGTNSNKNSSSSSSITYPKVITSQSSKNNISASKPIQSLKPQSSVTLQSSIPHDSLPFSSNTTSVSNSPYYSRKTLPSTATFNPSSKNNESTRCPVTPNGQTHSSLSFSSSFSNIDTSTIQSNTTPYSNTNRQSISSPYQSKRTKTSSIWPYIRFVFVAFIIGLIILSLIGSDYISTIKSAYSFTNFLYHLTLPLLFGLLSSPFWTVLFKIVSAIPDILYFQHKCPHGKFHGRKINRQTGLCKCYLCQTSIDEQRYQQRLQKKYREQYDHDLANAKEKRKRALISDGKSIHDITPQAFEDLIAILFRKLGYRVEQTPYTNDGGKDAIIYKDGKKYLVECKRYEASKRIGRPLMQKLYAAMCEEHAAGGFFVASCQYTQDALDYGKKFHIETIDLTQLLSLLHQNYDSTPDSNIYKLTCPNCGEPVFFALWNDIESRNCTNGHSTKNVFWDSETVKANNKLEKELEKKQKEHYLIKNKEKKNPSAKILETKPTSSGMNSARDHAQKIENKGGSNHLNPRNENYPFTTTKREIEKVAEIKADTKHSLSTLEKKKRAEIKHEYDGENGNILLPKQLKKELISVIDQYQDWIKKLESPYSRIDRHMIYMFRDYFWTTTVRVFEKLLINEKTCYINKNFSSIDMRCYFTIYRNLNSVLSDFQSALFTGYSKQAFLNEEERLSEKELCDAILCLFMCTLARSTINAIIAGNIKTGKKCDENEYNRYVSKIVEADRNFKNKFEKKNIRIVLQDEIDYYKELGKKIVN